MASYRFQDQVRDSSPSRKGLSKSQMSLHKILRIIASSAPGSSNQGSSSSARPEVESETDLSCVNRGIGIDLNMEFSPSCLLGGGGEGNEAVSAGSASEDDNNNNNNNNAPDASEEPPAAVKELEEEVSGSDESVAVVDQKSLEGEFDNRASDESKQPAEAAKEEEEEVSGSGESAAVVDQKSSEGEFDPNRNSNNDSGRDCSLPPAEASEATNLRIKGSREIGIDGISEEDDKREVGEEREVQNDSQRRADKESRAGETATSGEAGGEKNGNDQGHCGMADRRLTVVIEAAEELASGNDPSSSTSDRDEKPRTAEEEAEEEEEEESEPHSPSLRGRGRGGIGMRGTKRKRKRNKCWVVDLYRDNNDEARTATAAVSSRSKRGRRSQVLPSRYRDASMVMEPWTPLPRRRS